MNMVTTKRNKSRYQFFGGYKRNPCDGVGVLPSNENTEGTKKKDRKQSILTILYPQNKKSLFKTLFNYFINEMVLFRETK